MLFRQAQLRTIKSITSVKSKQARLFSMRLLHISDVHYNHSSYASEKIRDKLLSKLSTGELGKIDRVVITGDFRHASAQVKNKEKDVDVVNQTVSFLDSLVQAIGLEKQNVHFVPGNHETAIVDSKSDEGKRKLKAVRKIRDSYRHPNGNFSKADSKILLKRFSFFDKVVDAFYAETDIVSVWKNYSKSSEIHRYEKVDDFCFLNLNTAITSVNSKEDDGKIVVDCKDLYKTLKNIGKEVPIVVLAHHSLEVFRDEERREVRKLFDEYNVILYLYGHIHQPDEIKINDFFQIGTGSLGKADHYSDPTFCVYNINQGELCYARGYFFRDGDWHEDPGFTDKMSKCFPDYVLGINNLPERNKYFTGRNDKLDSIHKNLAKKEGVSIHQTVSGLGGIGKTQLAIEYAYRYCNSYANAIWFVVAETTTTVQSHFAAFAEKLSLPLVADYTPEDLQRVVSNWLAKNKDWLIIFDNVEFYDVVKPYLPNQINGRLIITTRNARVDVGEQIKLGVFNLDESVDFLRRRLSNETLKLEHYEFTDFKKQAPLLADRLGFLPLALEQAVAYIKEVKCSIEKYLKLFDESSLRAFEEKQSQPEHYEKSDDRKFEKIVTTTWTLSFKHIALKGSKQLFNLCAYMAPEKIPVAFFVEMRHKLPSPLREDLADEIGSNRVVTELRTYSLTSGNAEYINVHRLVQEVVRKSHERGEEI
jgi:predicted phosphodiesterase